MIKKSSAEFSRAIVGAVLVFSGFVKAVDVYGTILKITEYLNAFRLPMPIWITDILSFLLVGVEMMLGLLLLAGLFRKIVSRVTLSFFSIMTVITLYLALFDPIEDCGCFGDFLKLTNWQTFAKNIALTILCLCLCKNCQYMKPIHNGKQGIALITVCATCAVIVLIYYNYNYNPVFDFRQYSIGTNLRNHNAESGNVLLVYEKDGRQKEFTPEDAPWDDNTWKFVKTISSKKQTADVLNDFSIVKTIVDATGSHKEDVTDSIINQDGFLLFIIIREFDRNDYCVFDDLISLLKKENDKIYYLTAATDTDVDKNKAYLIPSIPIFQADYKTLSTIIRTNIGAFIVKDGVIRNKWVEKSLP